MKAKKEQTKREVTSTAICLSSEEETEEMPQKNKVDSTLKEITFQSTELLLFLGEPGLHLLTDPQLGSMIQHSLGRGVV
jgi:hypothetical protein